jgi:TonB family protein
VSLEQFKKQVLLLHSEQSTLDTLSTGFNDRYTVHCATSGSEALNTLGETQIDVIVSAQELPGMSGLEALREAKKRSPETIGILLAGNEHEGLEALVGDQEVFQVVRGQVTPESLRKMIDDAARHARLMALAESANDTTANPDEPIAEHIVMETSENGSAIISDGTGRMPALDPKKIDAAADVGARSVDVLVLTQDEEFLGTVQESARGLHNVIYANTVSQADEALRKNKVGVAVVDAAMVGANVEKMTMHLRASSPRLVAIVAGRRDDGEMLMDLINRGKVYRFLLKPVSPGRSRLAIEASVKHHLEAPDSAFKVTGAPAAAPAAAPRPKPEPKPEPKPVAKAAPKPQPKPQPAPEQKKPAPPKPQPAAKAPPKPAPAPAPKATAKPAETIVPNRDEALSPLDEGLSEAFGGDDTSFTETMTGIVETVTKSLKPKKKDKPAKIEPTAETSAMAIESSPATDGSGGSLFSSPKVLGLVAIAVLAAAGVGFWMLGGSGSLDTADVGQEPVAGEQTPAAEQRDADESIFTTEVVIPENLTVDELIDEARIAEDAGRIFSPPGNNAIELYLAALQAVPGDPVAQQGLDQTIEQALGQAESALLERRADDAQAALQSVALATPDNPRLPFLNAQLMQMQLREYLDTARAGIRELRFEDAQEAIRAAQALPVQDRSEINALEDDLREALSEQRVDEVLVQANASLEQGNLIAPSNDNARYYFELALRRDPNNTAARQGLVVVASKLVLQARAQIDQGNFDAADSLLVDARRLDPSSAEVAASTAALASARDRRAQEIRDAADKAAADRRAAEQRAADERAAEQRAAEQRVADQQAAEQRAAEQRVADQQAAEQRAAEERIAEQQAAEQRAAEFAALQAADNQTVVDEAATETQALVQEPVQEAVEERAPEPVAEDPVIEDPVIDAGAAVAGAGDAIETAQPVQAAITQQQQVAPAPAPVNTGPVSVSSLKRTKYVAPKYPRAAQRRGLSGWVDVLFTVDIDGTVTDISVRDSNPGDTFVNAATNAVEDWKFEPVLENGVAIQKRAAVRMMFAIE